ncbi:TPA: (4Fe-4S)-binding protein, partial [Escherichia coli]|nr:(4Fe-4S)-binding protein [Escherichia coli]
RVHYCWVRSVDVVTVVKVIDTCPSGALKYRHK